MFHGISKTQIMKISSLWAIQGVRIIVQMKNSFLGTPEGLWPVHSENNFYTFESQKEKEKSSEKPRLLVALSNVPSLHKSLICLIFCNLVQLLTIFCTDVNTDLPPLLFKTCFDASASDERSICLVSPLVISHWPRCLEINNPDDQTTFDEQIDDDDVNTDFFISQPAFGQADVSKSIS